MTNIPYTKPSISAKEVEYVTDAAENGWGSKCYEYIDRFESSFCEYTGATYAVATSSCTGALHLGLAALGIGVGDEVIIADSNWIASVAPVSYLGATPVFVDVELDSWCISPGEVKKAITSKTKAIIAVHLYGNLCDMDALISISEEYDIPLVEDAAEAFGSFYQQKHAGTLGEFGVFSFHGTKSITTGEGGIFITNNEQLYKRVLTLNNHGRNSTQTKQFWPDEIGFKYKMSNIQAAIGCAQLERAEDLVDRKRAIFNYYKQELKCFSQITFNPEREGCKNSYWMPTLVFSKSSEITREKLLEEFTKQHIDARVFFWPLSSLPAFEDDSCENPIAQDIPNRSINLPSYVDMSTDEQDRVIDVIKLMISN